jgi:hypothetical protein
VFVWFLLFASLFVHFEVVFAVWELPFVVFLAWELVAAVHTVGNTTPDSTIQNKTKNALATPFSVGFFFGYWFSS